MTGGTLAASIDYLIVGHVTADRRADGWLLGGSAAYSGLTAHAFGLRVGVVTSAAEELDLTPLSQLHLLRIPAAATTSFDNRYGSGGRRQRILARAEALTASHIPNLWRNPAIAHLAPVAQEVDADLAPMFPGALVMISAQGWLRQWNADGEVTPSPWSGKDRALADAGAVVASLEDLGGDERAAEDLAGRCRLLLLTEGERGVRVYWSGDVRRLSSPRVERVMDPTGAGDVFAAAFACRYHATHDPWEAARLAQRLAATSVTRRGLEAVPSPAEVQSALVEVLA
jgi:hypothetical protein